MRFFQILGCFWGGSGLAAFAIYSYRSRFVALGFIHRAVQFAAAVGLGAIALVAVLLE